MPRTHAAPGRAGPTGPAARSRPGAARRAACLAGAAGAVFAVTIAAGPAALGRPAQRQHAQAWHAQAWQAQAWQAQAWQTQAQQARAQQARDRSSRPSRQVSVVIDSVSPQWARPGRTVTVTGIVRNGTTAPQRGLSVELLSSARPFVYRTELAGYAAGTLPADFPEGAPKPLPGVIRPGGEVRWRATLQPAAVGMTGFGVYPLAAEVRSSAEVTIATDRTFLPFWPGRTASSRPRPLSIAWIWPLIDRPYQAACPALLGNGLARSLAASGRLGKLLAAGAGYSAAARLTWAIDPALVQNAQTMTSRYTVGGILDCGGARSVPPSQAASGWLSGLKTATSGQQVFLTPYADVDVAALSHDGRDPDLRSAFAARSVGRRILGLPPSSDKIAWPDNGHADSGVLGSLASDGITTVVLDSTVMPPSVQPLTGQPPNYTPSAQATTAAGGTGTLLNVLLADHQITQVLGAADAAGAGPGTAFAAGQRFLAETAMIVAERPQLPRSLVVVPPRRWNPAPGLADSLLRETVRAPWLKPASLAGLAAARHPRGEVRRHEPVSHQVSRGELSPAYLGRVHRFGSAISVQASILTPPVRGYLGTAISALESSAWRGGAQAGVRRSLIGRALDYVTAQGRKVAIIDRGPITLGGSSGKVPISITNRLTRAVHVRLHAHVPADKRLTVGSFDNLVLIEPGKTTTIRMPVHAATVGATYVTLGLLAPDGTPLPGTLVRLPVHATRFGRLALVIMCVALAVFVLTAAARAVRRARRDGRGGGGHDDPGSDPPGPAAVAGSVISGDDLAHDHPPEDPDEYADARGRASR